ncbi:MAG: cytochrome c [Burkholderiales bacterium]|nr:cytochrome c [Burkholderiales bacterium]
MKSKPLAAALTLVLGAGYAATALAQVKPEILVKQRQAKMVLQAKYFGPLAAMAQGKAPYDAKVVARNAGYLDVLTEMAWDGYDPSTKDVKSRTLPVAYTNADKFKQAQRQLETAVDQLVVAAKGGDEAKVKAAVGAVGKACGSCHDDFWEN